MNRLKWLKYTLAALFALTFAVPQGSAASKSTRGHKAPRVIEITANRLGFTPNQITIKKGETVKLRLTSDDVTHGFFMRKLKIDEDIGPGKTTEITLTPDTAGNFTAICDHFCGTNHGNMNLIITVVD